jgi:hypothetical protein
VGEVLFFRLGRFLRLRRRDDDLGRKPAAGRRGLVQTDVVLDVGKVKKKAIHVLGSLPESMCTSFAPAYEKHRINRLPILLFFFPSNKVPPEWRIIQPLLLPAALDAPLMALVRVGTKIRSSQVRTGVIESVKCWKVIVRQERRVRQ